MTDLRITKSPPKLCRGDEIYTDAIDRAFQEFGLVFTGPEKAVVHSRTPTDNPETTQIGLAEKDELEEGDTLVFYVVPNDTRIALVNVDIQDFLHDPVARSEFEALKARIDNLSSDAQSVRNSIPEWTYPGGSRA